MKRSRHWQASTAAGLLAALSASSAMAQTPGTVPARDETVTPRPLQRARAMRRPVIDLERMAKERRPGQVMPGDPPPFADRPSAPGVLDRDLLKPIPRAKPAPTPVAPVREAEPIIESVPEPTPAHPAPAAPVATRPSPEPAPIVVRETPREPAPVVVRAPEPAAPIEPAKPVVRTPEPAPVEAVRVETPAPAALVSTDAGIPRTAFQSQPGIYVSEVFTGSAPAAAPIAAVDPVTPVAAQEPVTVYAPVEPAAVAPAVAPSAPADPYNPEPSMNDEPSATAGTPAEPATEHRLVIREPEAPAAAPDPVTVTTPSEPVPSEPVAHSAPSMTPPETPAGLAPAPASEPEKVVGTQTPPAPQTTTPPEPPRYMNEQKQVDVPPSRPQDSGLLEDRIVQRMPAAAGFSGARVSLKSVHGDASQVQWRTGSTAWKTPEPGESIEGRVEVRAGIDADVKIIIDDLVEITIARLGRVVIERSNELGGGNMPSVTLARGAMEIRPLGEDGVGGENVHTRVRTPDQTFGVRAPVRVEYDAFGGTRRTLPQG